MTVPSSPDIPENFLSSSKGAKSLDIHILAQVQIGTVKLNLYHTNMSDIS